MKTLRFHKFTSDGTGVSGETTETRCIAHFLIQTLPRGNTDFAQGSESGRSWGSTVTKSSAESAVCEVAKESN